MPFSIRGSAVADSEILPASTPIEGGQHNVSVATDVAVVTAGIPAALGGLSVDIAKSKKLGIVGWLAIGWMVVVALMVIVPGIFPVTSLHDRSIEAITNDDFSPSLQHPLGLDTSGYDMLTKVV